MLRASGDIAVLPDPLEVNVRYEAEFTVGDESFEASLTYPDGKTAVIVKREILPGLRIHGLTFSGRADVAWIGSYDFPEKQSEACGQNRAFPQEKAFATTSPMSL